MNTNRLAVVVIAALVVGCGKSVTETEIRQANLLSHLAIYERCLHGDGATHPHLLLLPASRALDIAMDDTKLPDEQLQMLRRVVTETEQYLNRYETAELFSWCGDLDCKSESARMMFLENKAMADKSLSNHLHGLRLYTRGFTQNRPTR